MKKIINVLLLLSVTFILSAQDTLFMNDGTRIPVRLIEMKDNVVRYKKWSNLNGPVWEKQKSDIVEIKKEKLVPNVVNDDLNFSQCKNGNLSGENIVKTIDSVYYKGSESSEILKYVQSLPKCVNIKELGKYYFQRFEKSCDVGFEEDIIRDGETYIYIGAEKELPNVLGILSMIYARDSNEIKVNELIAKFEQFSKDNFDMFNDDIEQLKKETNDLLHPKLLKDQYVGTWVALNSGYEDESPMIIKIDDVTQPNGAYLLLPDEPISLIKNGNINTIHYKEKLSMSQGIRCVEDEHFCCVKFASETIKDNTWLTSTASAGIESVRKTGAEIHAILNSSKEATFGEKLGYGILTDVGVAAMSYLFSNMTKSSREVNEYRFLLLPPTDYAIAGRMKHLDVKYKNEGNYEFKSDTNAIKQDFVRWEESDSVLFVSSNGMPIVTRPFSYDEPLLEEYNQIKRNTSFWKPQYSVPYFAGNAVGICMMSVGLSRMVKGNDIGASFAIFSSGCVIIVASNIIPLQIRKHKRGNLFEELNTRSYEKLKHKVAAEISFVPLYNPMEKSIGASVNLKF